MPSIDKELQQVYDEINRQGWFKTDPEFQKIGHEMRAAGWINDPSQGGLMSQTTAAVPPQSVAPYRRGQFGFFNIKPGADIDGLTPSARSNLQAVNALLEQRGVKSGTITSGRRSGSLPSHHNTGDAVDVVLPGDMAAHAEWLKSQGFRAQFERRGQRNPNGSIASGDHIHITLKGPRRSGAGMGDVRLAEQMAVVTPRLQRPKSAVGELRAVEAKQTREAVGSQYIAEIGPQKTPVLNRLPKPVRAVAEFLNQFPETSEVLGQTGATGAERNRLIAEKVYPTLPPLAGKTEAERKQQIAAKNKLRDLIDVHVGFRNAAGELRDPRELETKEARTRMLASVREGLGRPLTTWEKTIWPTLVRQKFIEVSVLNPKLDQALKRDIVMNLVAEVAGAGIGGPVAAQVLKRVPGLKQAAKTAVGRVGQRVATEAIQAAPAAVGGGAGASAVAAQRVLQEGGTLEEAAQAARENFGAGVIGGITGHAAFRGLGVTPELVSGAAQAVRGRRGTELAVKEPAVTLSSGESINPVRASAERLATIRDAAAAAGDTVTAEAVRPWIERHEQWQAARGWQIPKPLLPKWEGEWNRGGNVARRHFNVLDTAAQKAKSPVVRDILEDAAQEVRGHEIDRFRADVAGEPMPDVPPPSVTIWRRLTDAQRDKLPKEVQTALMYLDGFNSARILDPTVREFELTGKSLSKQRAFVDDLHRQAMEKVGAEIPTAAPVTPVPAVTEAAPVTPPVNPEIEAELARMKQEVAQPQEARPEAGAPPTAYQAGLRRFQEREQPVGALESSPSLRSQAEIVAGRHGLEVPGAKPATTEAVTPTATVNRRVPTAAERAAQRAATIEVPPTPLTSRAEVVAKREVPHGVPVADVETARPAPPAGRGRGKRGSEGAVGAADAGVAAVEAAAPAVSRGKGRVAKPAARSVEAKPVAKAKTPKPDTARPRAVTAAEKATARAMKPAAAESPGPAARGKATTFKAAGRKHEGEWQVVELGDLVASHTATLAENPAYPKELQPRDRTRRQYEDQIASIVTKFDPEELGESLHAATGAPIVGEDRVVESGNGRVIALTRVYQTSKKKAAAYRDFVAKKAAELGVDPDAVGGMKEPVLVRVRKGELAPAERVRFTQDANAATAERMSPADQARADAERLTPDVMRHFAPDDEGNLATSRNQAFVKAFIKTLPEGERGALLTADGGISQEGLRRIQAAVFHAAYGDTKLLARLAESTDDATKNVTKGLLMAAAKIHKMRAEIAAGRLHDRDIVPDLTSAVNTYAGLRSRGVSVAEHLGQIGMFGETTPEFQASLLRWLEESKRSARRIGDRLSLYADELRQLGNPKQTATELKRVPSIADIWTRSERTLFDVPMTGRKGGEAGSPDTVRAETAEGPKRIRADRPAVVETGPARPGWTKRKAADVPAVYSDPMAQEWFARSHGRDVQPDRPWSETFNEFRTRLGHALTRQYEHLPQGGAFQKVRAALDVLGRPENTTEYKALKTMQDAFADLNKDERFRLGAALNARDLAETVRRGEELPEGLTPEIVAAMNADADRYLAEPKIKEAADARKQYMDGTVAEINALYEELFGFSPKLDRADYVHHEVLMDLATRKAVGTGGRLAHADTGAFYMKGRKGTRLTHNTNFFEAEQRVFTRMLGTVNKLRALKAIKEHDISTDVYAAWRVAKAEPGNERLSLSQFVAEKYPDHTPWRPDKGTTVAQFWNPEDRMLQRLEDALYDRANLTEGQNKQDFAFTGLQNWVIPDAIAKTLDEVVKPQGSDFESAVGRIIQSVQRGWKTFTLFGTGFIKYTTGNSYGDTHAAYLYTDPRRWGNITRLFHARAVPEVLKLAVGKGRESAELAAFLERAGMDSGQLRSELGVGAIDGTTRERIQRAFAQEPGLGKKIAFGTGRAIFELKEGYLNHVFRWDGARERLWRYTLFLDYLDQMRKSPDGLPKDYGASIPDEVRALDNIYDRAYHLANDAMGAYDKRTTVGRMIAKYLIPFWGYQEVNHKRASRYLTNQVRDVPEAAQRGKKLVAALGLGAKATPMMTARVALFAAKMAALEAALTAYNNSRYPDLEESLPDDVRRRPHLITGFDEKTGQATYLRKLGAIPDFYALFGLFDNVKLGRSWLNGEISTQDALKKAGDLTVQTLADSLGPAFKLADIASGIKSFGGKTIPVRDKLDAAIGAISGPIVQRGYRWLRGIPQPAYDPRKLAATVGDLEEMSYHHALDRLGDFQRKTGGSAGFTPKANALYWYRQAQRYGDAKLAEKYALEYFQEGGDKDGYTRVAQSLSPIGGMNPLQVEKWLKALEPREKRMVVRGLQHWADLFAPGYKVPKLKESELASELVTQEKRILAQAAILSLQPGGLGHRFLTTPGVIEQNVQQKLEKAGAR